MLQGREGRVHSVVWIEPSSLLERYFPNRDRRYGGIVRSEEFSLTGAELVDRIPRAEIGPSMVISKVHSSPAILKTYFPPLIEPSLEGRKEPSGKTTDSFQSPLLQGQTPDAGRIARLRRVPQCCRQGDLAFLRWVFQWVLWLCPFIDDFIRGHGLLFWAVYCTEWGGVRSIQLDDFWASPATRVACCMGSFHSVPMGPAAPPFRPLTQVSLEVCKPLLPKSYIILGTIGPEWLPVVLRPFLQAVKFRCINRHTQPPPLRGRFSRFS